MKKLFALIMAALMLLGAVPAMADAPQVEKIEYEGNGRVEIEFARDVKYRNFSVKVTDENGKKHSVSVSERDEDSVSLKISGVKAETDYKVVLRGVKARGTSGYGRVRVNFTTPVNPVSAPVVEKVEVKKNGRIEVDFAGKVQYGNLKVKIKDAEGKAYGVSVVEKDNDEINVKAAGLEAGKEYVLIINGIRAKGAEGYTKIKVPFATGADYVGPGGNGLKIRKVDSDAGDDEIEVEFNKNVQYSNLKVVVKNAAGQKMGVRIIDRDEDSVEVRVNGLERGERYTVKVSGVRKYGSAGKYKTLTYEFTARDD